MTPRIKARAAGIRRACLAGALLLLAACQTTGSTTPLKSAAETSSTVPVTAVQLALGHEQGSLKDVTPSELPPPSPQKLIGLTPERLTQALGEPDFRRTDRNAAIWQYAGPTCFLDLYLYRQKGRQLAVSHYEFRSRVVAKVDPAQCFATVLAHHYGQRRT